jgi:aminoglycoside phosphotransferase (APT) family kinase protein
MIADNIRSWAARAAGSPIVAVEKLTGGMTTNLDAMLTEAGDRVVLRRFMGPRWQATGSEAAAREARLLTALEHTAVPAPKLIDVDAAGEYCEAPAVLMEFMRGARTLLADTTRLAVELARTLAAIHAVSLPPGIGLPDETATILNALESGTHIHRAAPASELWQQVRNHRPAGLGASTVLIHNDFSPSNALFSGNRLTAVLDWPEAAVGHAAWDVAFCRLETGLTLGLAASDLIPAAYETQTGRPLEHLAWWDLVAACRLQPDLDTWTKSANYIGPAGLTVGEVKQRFDDHVSRAADLLASPSV